MNAVVPNPHHNRVDAVRQVWRHHLRKFRSIQRTAIEDNLSINQELNLLQLRLGRGIRPDLHSAVLNRKQQFNLAAGILPGFLLQPGKRTRPVSQCHGVGN